MKKILIFLFLNEKCYGSQLSRLMKTSLTPVQKALGRLEKGGMISSYYEGKTRVYQFNPGFPLLEELQHLLKKAYTLLPSQEKKLYSFVKNSVHTHEPKADLCFSVWEQLVQIKELTFHARTKMKDDAGRNGKGKGEVMVTKEGDSVLIFSERGSWKGLSGAEMDFTNTFRWTLDRFNKTISLEHLRRGWNHPVFIFHLTAAGAKVMSSVDPHICEEDTYFGQLHYDAQGLRLNWRIIGPRKNEELDYFYC